MPEGRPKYLANMAQLISYQNGQFFVRKNSMFRMSEYVGHAAIFLDDPLAHFPRGITGGRL